MGDKTLITFPNLPIEIGAIQLKKENLHKHARSTRVKARIEAALKDSSEKENGFKRLINPIGQSYITPETHLVVIVITEAGCFNTETITKAWKFETSAQNGSLNVSCELIFHLQSRATS